MPVRAYWDSTYVDAPVLCHIRSRHGGSTVDERELQSIVHALIEPQATVEVLSGVGKQDAALSLGRAIRNTVWKSWTTRKLRSRSHSDALEELGRKARVDGGDPHSEISAIRHVETFYGGSCSHNAGYRGS